MIGNENIGGQLPPKPQTGPNKALTPMLRDLVNSERNARFRASPKSNIERGVETPLSSNPQTQQDRLSGASQKEKIPLKVERGSLISKNSSPEDKKITRAQLVGRNVDTLATQELEKKVEETYGKRPSKSELRKLMQQDPSLGHYLRKTKRQLNNTFDPTGEFEEFRHYQGDTH